MRQPACQTQEWFKSDPPGVVFRRLGGVRGARHLANEVATRMQVGSDIRLFQAAFDQGNREGRWQSVNDMAAFLEVDRNWLGRLIRGDDNVATMKVGDLYRCASMLRVLLKVETPSPEHIERHVLHAVVQGMREQRRNGSKKGWPDLQREDEAESIRGRARRVGYIDDAPAREAGPWRKWLTDQTASTRTPEPIQDPSASLLQVVGLGDWLVAQPYLPHYESLLYSNLRTLEQSALKRKDDELMNILLAFLRPLGEAQEMLSLFRSTVDGTVEEVAKKRHWRPATVEVRLARLKLTADDFCGEEAVLGRLIIRSPVLRPLFDGLLSHRDWSAASTDSPCERRGQ